MPRKVKKVKDLKGLFIYQDKYNGTVYYDIFTKNGYILSNDDINTYTLSIAFLPLAIVFFYFATRFKIDTVWSLVIALGFYIVAHVIFRFAFLYKLPCVENYNKEKKESIIDNLTSNYSKQRLILLEVFLFALIGVTIAYVLTSNFKGIILFALWVLVAITILFFIFVLIMISRKK